MSKHTRTLELEQKFTKKIIDLYEQYGNGSATRIAMDLTLPLTFVKRILKEAGYDLSCRYPKSVKNRARKLYTKHQSTYKVARIMGLTHETIYYWVKDLVPKHAKKKRFTKKDIQKALRLRRQGWTTNDIAKEIGTDAPLITIWVRKHGKGFKIDGVWQA